MARNICRKAEMITTQRETECSVDKPKTIFSISK